MKIEPDGIEDVVVLIKSDNFYQYYVSEKECWMLNITVLEVADWPNEDIRYGIPILNEDNICEFKEGIKKLEVSKKELKEYYMIYKELYGDLDAHYTATPIFYIDFDKKEFYSFYTEPGSYEEYMPKGWDGYNKAGEYDRYIPLEMKYW
ncbi:hypothetical protein [Clostridium sp. ZBS12]|uniref:hypothetical protein n=1 Tax=Clostridium sp. ZBS12 TaxID=2949972 RepID=UPI00207A4AE7|nr:hypothetical protein [Clostridium sp. ZBS12]